MNIIITPEVKLTEVQQLLNKKFPLLTIRYFETAVNYITGKAMEGKRIEEKELTFGDLNHQLKNICLAVTPETKVKDLEKSFHEKLDVFIQVYRKSGNLWLQTTATDNMTLAEVEKLSEMMSEEKDKIEPEDYHEQV